MIGEMLFTKGEEIRGDDGKLWGVANRDVPFAQGTIQAFSFTRVDGSVPIPCDPIEKPFWEALQRKKVVK